MTEKAIPFAELKRIAKQNSGPLPILCLPNGITSKVTREQLRWVVGVGEETYNKSWWAEPRRRYGT